MQTMAERSNAKFKWLMQSKPNCDNCIKSEKCKRVKTLCTEWVGNIEKIRRENNDNKKE